MRLLFEISPVPELFSAVCARAVSKYGEWNRPVLRTAVAARGIRPAKNIGERMRYPLKMTANLARYVATQRFRGAEKFPMVMMLEPLHACNLTCTGCGRIREYKSTINEIMTVEQCLAASDECGAPVVSICGGEPMIYPEIGRLAREILERGRHIILCTNGMFIRKRLHEFKPTSSFFFNVHLDGLERTHDLCVEKDGVFREAIEGVKAAKAAGFMVCSNTTIYKETDLNEIADLY